MKKLRLTALVVLMCGPSFDSPRRLLAAYSRPQNTIASYWHRMLERRHVSALDCFLGSSPEDARNMIALPELVELRCRDFRVRDRGRGQVDVAYVVEYRVAMGDSLASFVTGDRLHLTQRGWKIAHPLLLASRSR